MAANHEKIHTISEVVRDQLCLHELEGGTHDDKIAGRIARRALQAYMPEIARLRNERVVVDAAYALTYENGRFNPVDDLHAEAQLCRVITRPIIMTVPDTDPPITYTTYDLCAVLNPPYVNTEPDYLVFCDTLYVPFGAIQAFDPVVPRSDAPYSAKSM